ncbi:MAG TPA: hypothetical protein PK114_04660 [Smithellaceae bacterium]|nr:hypothetical protein [Smithellaceae bacterium]
MIFFFHKLFMGVAALFLLTGVSVAVFLRRRRYWLKMHKLLNSCGGMLLLTGGILAAIMVSQQQGEHFAGFHAIAGIIALILTITSFLLGFYQLKASFAKQTLRNIHRRLGVLSLASIIVALVAGLILVGII